MLCSHFGAEAVATKFVRLPKVLAPDLGFDSPSAVESFHPIEVMPLCECLGNCWRLCGNLAQQADLSALHRSSTASLC